MISTIVWGTGNVGRAAIRAVDCPPGARISPAVLVHNPDKVGRDAGDLAGPRPRTGGRRHRRHRRGARRPVRGAVVYAASGDIRPDEALADIVPGDPRRRRRRHPGALRRSTTRATPGRRCANRCWQPSPTGGGSLFVSGVDPGWGNDVLPLLISGLGRHRRRDPLPGDLRLLHLRPARLGALPRRHGPADGLRAADARADASRRWCGAGRSG